MYTFSCRQCEFDSVMGRGKPTTIEKADPEVLKQLARDHMAKHKKNGDIDDFKEPEARGRKILCEPLLYDD